MKYETMNNDKWRELRRTAGYAHASEGSEVKKLLEIAQRLLENSKEDLIPSRKLVFGIETKTLSLEYNRMVALISSLLSIFISAPLYYIFFQIRDVIEFWPLLPTLFGLVAYGIFLRKLSKEGVLHDVNPKKYNREIRKNILKREKDILARYSQAANFLDALGNFPPNESIWDAAKHQMAELAFKSEKQDRYRGYLKNFISLIITLRLHTESMNLAEKEIADKLYAKAFKDSASFAGHGGSAIIG